VRAERNYQGDSKGAKAETIGLCFLKTSSNKQKNQIYAATYFTQME
jgi:hypothetical protein